MREIDVALGPRSYPVLIGDGARHELARLVPAAANRRSWSPRMRSRVRGGSSGWTRACPFEVCTIGEGEGEQDAGHGREPVPPFRPDRALPLRCGDCGRGRHRDRRGGIRRGLVPPGDGLRERRHDLVGPGRRGHRREDRREPARGEEPGGRLLAAPRRPVRHRDAHDAFASGVGVRPGAKWPSTPSWASHRLRRQRPIWTEQVARCVAIKAEVVAADEREGDRRMVLNYGHTLAHALEGAGLADHPQWDLRHGEAVAIGLIFAALLAQRLGRIDDTRVKQHRAVVGSYDLPMDLPAGAVAAELVTFMGRDKKAQQDLTFVLDGPRGVEPVRGVADADVLATLADMGALP